MKPNPFVYVRAQSLDEVFAVLSEHGDEAKILAGGQSLIPTMNMRFAAPEVLVDVSRVADLQGIQMLDGALRIGAMSRHVDVMTSPDVAASAPLIAAAMPHIAHATIRNRGTFGGSLCHADPASELPACCLALNARFNVQGVNGARTVAAEDFFFGTYTTCLADDEILVSVDIPAAAPETVTFFDEVARRRGDYAMAGLAATATVQGNALADAQLVFFGVGEMAMPAPSAAALMEGRPVTDVDVDAVLNALSNDIEPFDDLTTSGPAKMTIMKALTRRALAAFAGGGNA